MSRLVITERAVYLYQTMTADIEGIAFVRDGEPVALTGKDAGHFAAP